MILKKASAVLGYPGEVSKPLDADHHDVCKFASREDINYKSLRAALQSLVSTCRDEGNYFMPIIYFFIVDNHFRFAGDNIAQEAVYQECQIINEYLSTTYFTPEHDLNFFWSRRNSHTCNWILETTEYQEWVETPSNSAVMWLHAKPGRGKSVLSSYLVHHLLGRGAMVQYFFFRYGQQTKRSLGTLLRTLAVQLAQSFSAFRKSLLRIKNSGLSFRNADWRFIWERIFKSALFPLDLTTPVYWIIDGLDESDAPSSVMDMLSCIDLSSTPIRVLLVSRWSTSLSSSFERLGSKTLSSILRGDDASADILIYAQEEIRYLPWPAEVKTEVTQKVTNQANGSFLWVHLVLEEVKNCHTLEQIKAALSELPDGMEPLYERMEAAISRNRRDSDTGLQRFLFIWAIYSRTSITTEEMCQAVKPQWSLLDLEFTISRMCGHFIIIEDGQCLGLIHETAREYLTSRSTLPFSLEPCQAHYDIFSKSISAFMNPQLHSDLRNGERRVSAEYRASSWAYHLNLVSISQHSDSAIDLLAEFFRRKSVFFWIQLLANLDKLRTLIDTSRRLSTFLQGLREGDPTETRPCPRLAEIESLRLWTRDLLKLVAKYGSNLLLYPTAIHDCVVPFCPQDSAIFKTFQNNSPSTIRVLGLPEDWDDCLTRVSVGNTRHATKISCSGRSLAVLDSADTITLWDCETFEELRKFSHNEYKEYIYSFCLSQGGDYVVSYSAYTTRIWSGESGELIRSIQNIAGVRAMALTFAEDDTILMMASDNHHVYAASVVEGSTTSTWQPVGNSIADNDFNVSGVYLNCPTFLSFSHDRTKIAATYRRFPLTVWSLKPTRLIKRITRIRANERSPTTSMIFVTHAQWHPNNEEMLGILNDGCIFKTHIFSNSQQELEAEPGKMPSRIQCSPDGRVFATSDFSGTIRLYDYHTFSQLYQLTSEDMVMGFCFSHDSRRFYDIRGSYCNIWEPSVLMDIDYSRDAQSKNGSVTQSDINSEAFADTVVPITELCPAGRGTVVCTGDEDGVVEIHDYATGAKKRLGQSSSQVSVDHMTWSSDCTHFAYADSVRGAKVSVFSLRTPSKNAVYEHELVGQFKPQSETGVITQILLSPDGILLLVAFSQTVQLWSTGTCSQLVPTYDAAPFPRRWMEHPIHQGQVLSMTPTMIVAHKWEDLSEIAQWVISSEIRLEAKTAAPWNLATKPNIQPNYGDIAEEEVSETLCTHSKTHLILTISRKLSSLRLRWRFIVIPLAPLLKESSSPAAADSPSRADQAPIPDDVAIQIERPLNIFASDRLVFVDRSFWLCSWHLDSAADPSSSVSTNIKRHFFLPRDWITPDMVRLLHLAETGTLLCPRRGELTVIESSLNAG
jgi:WD40 repeat protein